MKVKSDVKHFVIYRNNPVLALYALLIASLPWFSFRAESMNLSLALVILLGIAGIIIAKVVIRKSVGRVFDIFDSLVFAYLLYAILSHIVVSGDNFWIPIMKTTVYYGCFLALKLSLVESSYKDIEKATLHGVAWGGIVFVGSIFIALYVKGNIGVVFADVSYSNTTIKIYGALNALFFGEADVSSRDVLRSALGEVFSFYLIFLVVTLPSMLSLYKKNIFMFGLIPMASTLLVGIFSRRSIFGAIISITAFIFSKKGSAIFKILGVLIVIFSAYVLIFVVVEDDRILSFYDSPRLQQYQYVIERIDERPILGHGYGAKIYDNKYVHNFLLASAHMLGVVGLILGMFIFLYLVFCFGRGVIGKGSNPYSYLLIIPIFGMIVGSTVEGMFTIIGWVSIGLYAIMSAKRKESIETFAE